MRTRAIIIRESADLMNAVKAEREARDMSAEELDHAIGLTRGHACKFENGLKPWGRQSFNMQPLVGWVLQYFGLSLVLMPSEMAERLIETGADIRDQRRPYVPRMNSRSPGQPASETRMAVITRWLRSN